MNEFLTSLSSGQPLLWAGFVLGAVAAAALSLSLFWGTLFRVAEAVTAFRRGRQGRPPTDGGDVLS